MTRTTKNTFSKIIANLSFQCNLNWIKTNVKHLHYIRSKFIAKCHQNCPTCSIDRLIFMITDVKVNSYHDLNVHCTPLTLQTVFIEVSLKLCYNFIVNQ